MPHSRLPLTVSGKRGFGAGWPVGATAHNATAGLWTRVDPVGTAAQPENDSSDAGALCFVTGQGGSLARVDYAVVLAPGSDNAMLVSSSASGEAPEDGRTAAGADTDWLALGDGPTEFLFPQADHNPRAPAVRVVIRHRAGERVDLRSALRSDDPEAQLAAALGPVADPVQEAPETAQIIALEAVLAQKDAARAAEEKPSMRRDLFDLDAAPEQGSTPPAPIIALTPPAPQPPEMPVESTQSTARGQMAARLRQAQRAGGLPQPEVLLPLSARLAALRDRLAEGTRKRPR